MALPVALYRCNIFLKAAMLLGCDDAVVGLPTLCASMYYSMYNDRLELIPKFHSELNHLDF